MLPLSAKTREESAFWSELVARYRAPLYAYFFRRVKNTTEAEDLTQEAFSRLARHPDKPHDSGVQGYIFTIAANLLTDRVRTRTSKKANDHRSLDDGDVKYIFSAQLTEDRNPERVLLAREALKDVMAALGELSERTRDIFIMSRLENMRQREIADIYGISVSAVEKHVMKALAHIGARFL